MVRVPAVCMVLLMPVLSCTTDRPVADAEVQRSRPAEMPSPQPAVRQSYRVIRTLPHDNEAFTQGLVVYQGRFIESTGQNGLSSIRAVDILTGRVQQIAKLEAQYFGEGLTVLGGRAYMLSWLSQTGFIFNASTLQQQGTFSYLGEGWGLTNDGTFLIMSNGTSVLTVLDPATFHVVRTIGVTNAGRDVAMLNELEWVDGEIWANVWRTNDIVRIDPLNGKVIGVIDCTGILPEAEFTGTTDVMNGIAYDSVKKALYVTGKNWPHVYQIEVQ